MKLEAQSLIDELPGASGYQCDVSSDAEIDAVFATFKEKFGKLDILVHAVAYAPAEELARRVHQHHARRLPHRQRHQRLLADRREPRRRAADDRGRQHHDHELLRRRKGRSQLQRDGGGQGRPGVHGPLSGLQPGPEEIRVNAISAGPIKTLAARGVGDLSEMMRSHAERAPLHRNIDQSEVGGAALFLASDLSSAITGEIMYVDCGYNIMGFDPSMNVAGACVCARR